MWPRLLLALCVTLLAFLASLSPAYTASGELTGIAPTHPHTYIPTYPHTASFPPDALPALCPAIYQLQHPTLCPDVGPGRYAGQIAAAGLPYPLPAVRVSPESPYRGLMSHAYAQVVTETAPVYRHPLEMLAGLPPFRRFENGFEFVSLTGQVTLQGASFYQINPGEFMRAEDLDPVRPSFFHGVFLAEPAAGPVGWVIGAVQPSRAPGQPPDPAAPYLWRYHQFQVHGVQRAGDWNWYLIGPGQWVEQRSVALVQPFPPAGAAGNVIAVDTYEQSLGVYQDGRLVFATLVSSGSRYFPTRPGVFNVWVKFTEGVMSGAYLGDRRDYYFLEDVPWILYYDGERALHGAYWHDNFGVRSSHGCVNLSPRDARWLYEYAGVGSTVVIFSSAPAGVSSGS